MRYVQDGFPARLRMAMLSTGTSNSYLAKSTGLSASNISHLTTGQRLPSLKTLQTLLLAIPQIDARWLITGAREKHGRI
jgi:transcriptional regulator with XRE-family HTH domain